MAESNKPDAPKPPPPPPPPPPARPPARMIRESYGDYTTRRNNKDDNKR